MMADLMENQNCESPKVDEIPDLGMVLGQNQTFGFPAGRCSAAQAENIRRLRNEELYKQAVTSARSKSPQHHPRSRRHQFSVRTLIKSSPAN